ncbi:hypothetical protein ATANTOWER_013532 [Ataeniobius toweri]|uniref:Uncharacterized protein n=1 Tax=Ataeniobius toweri TaxID=208326 RepID=A0ABU7A659_9TELE|nr:hypothetical protein [Ataeniobius toweri]
MELVLTVLGQNKLENPTFKRRKAVWMARTGPAQRVQLHGCCCSLVSCLTVTRQQEVPPPQLQPSQLDLNQYRTRTMTEQPFQIPELNSQVWSLSRSAGPEMMQEHEAAELILGTSGAENKVQIHHQTSEHQ